MRSNLKNNCSRDDRPLTTIRPWTVTCGLLTIAFVSMLAISCKKKDQATGDTYTCPMHPTVISDKPGTCPVCGMDLVRAKAGEEVKMTKELEKLTQSPNEVVISTVKTIHGESKLI